MLTVSWRAGEQTYHSLPAGKEVFHRVLRDKHLMTLIYKFQRDAEQAPAKGLMRVVLRQVLQAVDLCPDYDIFAEQIRQHSTMGLWGPSLDPREMTASQREIWQRYDARGVTAYPQLLKREVLYNNEHTLCIRDWLGPNARDMRGDIRVVDREVDPSEPDSRGIFPIPCAMSLLRHPRRERPAGVPLSASTSGGFQQCACKSSPQTHLISDIVEPNLSGRCHQRCDPEFDRCHMLAEPKWSPRLTAWACL
jgi:hypothetical protein